MTLKIHPSNNKDNIQGSSNENASSFSSSNLRGTLRTSQEISLFSYQSIDEDLEIENQVNLYQKLKNTITQSSKKEDTKKRSSLVRYPFLQSYGISHNLFLHSKYIYPFIRKVFIIFILFLLICMIYLYSYIYVNNFQYLPVTNYKNDDPNIPTYRLTFIGDSLIHRPFTEFDLGGRLQRHFRSINLDIIDNARNGQEIAKCRENIYKDVPMNSSDMVILFWDSDCSNIDESILNQDQINEIRANYRSNLTQVIEAVKAAGVKYMAVSGPNLLGEGPNSPLRHVFFPSFVNDKTNMLNA